MINMKKLLTKILQTLEDTVASTGSTMSGDLAVEKENAASRVIVRCMDGETTIADGQLSVSEYGSCGVYDNLHSKWVIRTDANGAQHIPFSATTIYSTKKACTSVSNTYSYTTVSDIASWNIVAVRFTVYETTMLLFFVRGESGERSLTDNPNAGRFRGGVFVDWTNNRIGIRCLSAGTSGTHYNLVYFDRVYGVL